MLRVRALIIGLLLASTLVTVPSRAQRGSKESTRSAAFSWDGTRRALFVDLDFRDVVDAEIRRKLSRGLPTKILLTALLYRGSQRTPVSTTYQSCKITWHVWEEMYLIEISRPNEAKPKRQWSPTLGGVLRRCARAKRLLAADSKQVDPRVPVYLRATVRVNPVSADLLSKLRRWVSRPARTRTVTPGSALFSTFTGLFMQRIGDAERTLHFRTFTRIPSDSSQET